MRIAVVGMGKIGLPLALQFARKGHSVVGTDINADRVDLINAGLEPFPNETGLSDRLSREVSEGRFTASTDTGRVVSESEAVVIVVPLMLDDDLQPDFSAIDTVTRVVADNLRIGTLVSYETTLPVGTTRNRLVPLLQIGSGLVAGDDFFVVFSPERVSTGRVFSDLRRYPKLVGGTDARSEARGIAFYRAVLDFEDRPDLSRPNGVWGLGSAEAAEMAKLAETTYRDVNIGLANQFALFAERNGISISAVIEACNSQPFSHIHNPGIAVGGHCIPVYPCLYLWNDAEASIVREARAVNARMPASVIARLTAVVGDLQGKTVAILGASYRGGVKESALSGVFPTADALQAEGATVRVHDPLFSDEELVALGLTPHHRGDPADVVILQADHVEYATWRGEDTPGVTAVLDGRGVIDQSLWGDAVTHLRIGHPTT